MKISLVVVEKTKSKDLNASIQEYVKRISHYTSFDFIETTEEKLLDTMKKFERVFLLDESGKEYTSKEFAGLIEKQLNGSFKSVAFVIGGPFGFKDDVHTHAHASLSLSKMTFPHDIVRVIFLEQLYRAFTILRNEKYHHE